MPVNIVESASPAKSWAPAITASAAGLALPAHSVLFHGTRYDVPAMAIPCVYTDDASYRVALCKGPTGPAIVLVEDDVIPSGYEQIVYLARWRLSAPTDTCATVAIEVPKRALVPRVGDDGQLVALPAPTPVTVSTTPVLPVASTEKTRGRKRLKRIKALTDDCRAMREAGTTFASMTAAEKAKVNELVALLADVPLAVP